MNLDELILEKIQAAMQSLFQASLPANVKLQPTNKEFEGSHTLVCFPLAKLTKKKPEETATALGNYLVEDGQLVNRFNVVKGFLNLVLHDAVWVSALQEIYKKPAYGQQPDRGEELMVEYSSPNTNKPLHLGHLRNNFLGASVSEIYKAMGYQVHRVQIINDRGIHICKSMAAWILYGEGETPELSGIKGDHLVGKYYVTFDKVYKAQVAALEEKGAAKEEAEKEAPIMQKAQELLRQWEQKNPDVLALWKKMNGWVYEGFEATYKTMGVDFDKLYYESDTYLLGKEQVLEGLEKGIFFKKEDNSVWVDLAEDGLDQKLLLRADGTSVYMTQDIGTAILRFNDFPNITGQVYTVGNEQEYHFKVLFLILNKLGYDWAKRCYHLSYGMVDLPTGRMKSREGTVVDADDLIAEMIAEAEKQTRELSKVDEDMTDEAARQLFRMIGLGALKFFLLKVDPKKRMLFDPTESIQLQGFTGPFIQYTHARIRAIVRKAEAMGIQVEDKAFQITSLEPAEQEVLQVLLMFEGKIKEAAKDYSPAVIANYAYELAREYNQFYQSIPIFNEQDAARLMFRVAFSISVAATLKKAMALLGIEVPEKM